RDTASDLYRLVRPTAPIGALDYLRSQEAFVNSLTGAQQARMLAAGVPFAELSPAQQNLWLRINGFKAYATAVREFHRAALCLGAWDRVRVRDGSVPGGRRLQLWLVYPDPAAGRGEGVVNIGTPRPDASARRSQPDGIDLPLTEPVRSSLRDGWRIPVQKTTLGCCLPGSRRKGDRT
ncbi:MAG TPA: hypothetical protein VFU47_12365, partial [Armatimonadota bacterium]|nr:hypothetical protein [Armatimonadota bacterium]